FALARVPSRCDGSSHLRKSVMARGPAEESLGGVATSSAGWPIGYPPYVYFGAAAARRVVEDVSHPSSPGGQNWPPRGYGVRAGPAVTGQTLNCGTRGLTPCISFSTWTLHPLDGSSTGGESIAIDQGTPECSFLRSC